MRSRSLQGFVAAAGLVLTVAIAAGANAADPPEKGGADGKAPKVPKCVGVSSEARFSGYGYDHLVEIDNRCDKSVSCTVATDVNPQSRTVTVAAGAKESLLTFRGSPASAFKPDVTCKLAS